VTSRINHSGRDRSSGWLSRPAMKPVERGAERAVDDVGAQMSPEVEVRVVLPTGTRPAAPGTHDAATETRVAVDDSSLDDGAQVVEVGSAVEHEDCRDDHQVRRPLHAQPCRVLRWHGIGAERSPHR
jgi:hypothetical protein